MKLIKLIKIETLMRWSARLLTVLVLAQGAHITNLQAMLFDVAAEQAERSAARTAESHEILNIQARELAEQRPVAYMQHADVLMSRHGIPGSGAITPAEAAAVRIKLKRFPQMGEKQALQDAATALRAIWKRQQGK